MIQGNVIHTWRKLSKTQRKELRRLAMRAKDAGMRCRCKVVLALVQGTTPTMIAQGGLFAKSQVSLPESRPIPDPPPICDANGADERSASSITLTSAYLMLSGPRSAEQLWVPRRAYSYLPGTDPTDRCYLRSTSPFLVQRLNRYDGHLPGSFQCSPWLYLSPPRQISARCSVHGHSGHHDYRFCTPVLGHRIQPGCSLRLRSLLA